MKTSLERLCRNRNLRSHRFVVTAAAIAALLLSCTLHAALPTPLVNLRFSENTGVTAANSGSLAGEASLVQPDGTGLPAFTNNVPTGLYAPAANSSSMDFGLIAAGQYGRAVDLNTTAGDGSGTLGPLNQFTVCGWLNARDLAVGWGGNRIAFALDRGDGSGFDLVQQDNGSLRIGINQWPDGANGGGPASSAGVLKADPQAGAANWVFFAVTYDPTLASGNVKYYFGSPQNLAALDSSHNYKGLDIGLTGELPFTGRLTLGNFGDVIEARNDAGSSRVFRGLMDEIKIYDQALDLVGIQEAQLNGAPPPVAVTITKQPANVTVFVGQPATFSVQVSGSAPYTYQWQRGGVNIPGATDESYTVSSVAAADNGAVFRVKVSNAVVSNVQSESATLSVLVDNGPRVALSFSEGGGIVTNTGLLLGGGVYAIRDTYPSVSGKIPAGTFAPTENISSVDFGGIAAGQGGRAIDLTNQFGGTLNSMSAFTLMGWLNCRDLSEGWGGNRVAFALDAPNGNGFDLVQTGNGSLRIGINQWPDGANGGGPASSPGMIKADSENGAANWVFFAVTYDSALPGGNLSYYFGAPDQAAQLDVVADYLQGAIQRSGGLTIGNFSTVVGDRNATGPGGGSRCFRGLIDEFKVYGKALTLEEIQAAQKSPAYKPVVIDPVAITQNPQNVAVFAGQNTTLRVAVSGTPPFTYQWWQSHGGSESVINNATNQTYTVEGATANNHGDQFWVVVGNQKNSVTSQRASLTVLPETNHKVSLSFSEGTVTTTANLGNIGGVANIVLANGFPVFTNLVPAGAFAPVNNASSLDFGSIFDGEGGRALDLVPTVTPTIGTMKGFTVTGWLNSRDLSYGWGGNRILYCQAGLGSGGFDVVQQADGILWVGVNTWPDGQPNSPAKSSPRITADPETGNANWVFFAFTYDGTTSAGNASFYFGSPTEAAALDVTVDFDAGAINSIGQLSIGNFSGVDTGARNGTGSQNSRCFRGLMDELNVYNKVLTLEEIQAVQKAPAGVPVAESPKLNVSRNQNQLAFSWTSSANFQLQYRDELGAGTWNDETTAPAVNGTQRTVTLPMTGSVRFYRLIGR